MSFALFRELTPTERELHLRRLQLRRLRATLTARELALGELRDRIISFEGRYLRQVGILLRELDTWEQRIAEQRVKHNLSRPSETPIVAEPDEPAKLCPPHPADSSSTFAPSSASSPSASTPTSPPPPLTSSTAPA